jgi:hypothetical protein
MFPVSKRAARQKRRRNIIAAVVVGTLICGLMGWLFWHFD